MVWESLLDSIIIRDGKARRCRGEFHTLTDPPRPRSNYNVAYHFGASERAIDFESDAGTAFSAPGWFQESAKSYPLR